MVTIDVPLSQSDYFHLGASNWVWGFLTDGPDAHHAGGFRRLGVGVMLDGDVVRLALDMDGGKIWFGKNNLWADGDPATGLDPSFSELTGELYAAMWIGTRQCSTATEHLTAITNFGSSPFSYPVPAGFNSGFGPLTVSVGIDIKPGETPNSINPSSGQKIPVAILTTASFDALDVFYALEADPLSVQFGPDAATESHERGHVEDVDGDGDMDLLLHFNTRDTGIQCGDTSASLIGQTFGGEEITGSDAINTVSCP